LVDPALRIAQDVHDQGFPFLKGFYCAKRLETRSSRRPQEEFARVEHGQEYWLRMRSYGWL
jgi:hypothetical protein